MVLCDSRALDTTGYNKQFIDAVKGYLRANYNVSGFNSHKKKVAFMLILMEGNNIAL